jgi:hypothetical protein
MASSKVLCVGVAKSEGRWSVREIFDVRSVDSSSHLKGRKIDFQDKGAAASLRVLPGNVRQYSLFRGVEDGSHEDGGAGRGARAKHDGVKIAPTSELNDGAILRNEDFKLRDALCIQRKRLCHTFVFSSRWLKHNFDQI